MMRNSSAPRPRIQTLALTAVIIASGIIAALAALGCRGGGANPGDDDLVIPFVEPTLSDRTCLNDFYPPTAPTFDEVSETDFRPGANDVDYIILEAGEGESPEIDWQVETHYTGWLEDGCVFGTTYSNDRAARFFLAYVIPGWRQSILDMNIGERRRVRVPSQLGYGEAGSPPRIPANATLYFDVTLIDGITSTTSHGHRNRRQRSRSRHHHRNLRRSSSHLHRHRRRSHRHRRRSHRTRNQRRPITTPNHPHASQTLQHSSIKRTSLGL